MVRWAALSQRKALALARDTRMTTKENSMNGPDHYSEAERLLDEAATRAVNNFNPSAKWCLELAKLHTALANVAATAQASDSREWVRVAGPWFSDLSLALPEQDRT